MKREGIVQCKKLKQNKNYISMSFLCLYSYFNTIVTLKLTEVIILPEVQHNTLTYTTYPAKTTIC